MTPADPCPAKPETYWTQRSVSITPAFGGFVVRLNLPCVPYIEGERASERYWIDIPAICPVVGDLLKMLDTYLTGDVETLNNMADEYTYSDVACLHRDGGPP